MAFVENYGICRVYPTMEQFKADLWATVVPITNTTRPEMTGGGLLFSDRAWLFGQAYFLAVGLMILLSQSLV